MTSRYTTQLTNFPSYEITIEGEVYSLKSKRYLKPSSCHGGYQHVSLYENGVRTTRNIHRLVAETFIPNVDNHPCVLHKDDNPLNNHQENLRWGTHTDNMRESWSKGRKEKVRENLREAIQIKLTWIHPLFGSFFGSATELVRQYSEQQLHHSCLRRVATKSQGRTQHKDWRVQS